MVGSRVCNLTKGSSMKQLYAFAMMVSLVGMFIFGLLGYQWVVEGHGLHPILATIVVVYCASVGYFAAGRLEELE